LLDLEQVSTYLREYVLDLLEETGLLGSRLVDVSMDPNKKLLKGEGELFEDPGRYRRLVGKLNYLTRSCYLHYSVFEETTWSRDTV
jgi:hypothetical protein